MYKLMILENEASIRNNIVKCMKWSKLGFEVSYVVSDEQKAIEQIQTIKPDVVLTDIMMPIVDGLELAIYIHVNFKKIKVVIMNKSTNFDHARMEMEYNIFKYLTKPVNIKQLAKTFLQLRLEFEKNNVKNNIANILNDELIELRKELITQLLDGNIKTSDILQNKINNLGINLAGKFYSVSTICIDIDDDYVLSKCKNDKSLLMAAYLNIVNELLLSKNCGIVCVRSIHEINIIFSYNVQKDFPKLIKSIIKNAIHKIKLLLFDDDFEGIYAGISTFSKDILNLNKFYLQSQNAIKSRFFVLENNMNNIFVYDNKTIEIEYEEIEAFYAQAYYIVKETIASNNENVKTSMINLFEQLYRCKNPELIKKYCSVICFLLKTGLYEFGDKYKSIEINNRDYNHDINISYSFFTLRNYIINLFMKSAEDINSLNELDYSNQKKLIEQVKQYINKNFSKDLSLEEISKHVSLSPTYLSSLFKNETGVTYTEYLKGVRMAHAQKLLKTIDLKVYEVANMIGYNDYKYFTIQFKKRFGLSPSEYRNEKIV